MFTSSAVVLTLTKQVLLEKIPTVGDVTVTRGAAPAGYLHGFTWTVTFETNIGDLRAIHVDGNATAVPLAGPDVYLAVTEVRRGVTPTLDFDVTGLEAGETYFARASAINSAGAGPTTLVTATSGVNRGSNNDGVGIAPLAIVARTAPAAPAIEDVGVISASQLEVTLGKGSDPPGSEPMGYKVCAAAAIWISSKFLRATCSTAWFYEGHDPSAFVDGAARTSRYNVFTEAAPYRGSSRGMTYVKSGLDTSHGNPLSTRTEERRSRGS